MTFNGSQIFVLIFLHYYDPPWINVIIINPVWLGHSGLHLLYFSLVSVFALRINTSQTNLKPISHIFGTLGALMWRSQLFVWAYQERRAEAPKSASAQLMSSTLSRVQTVFAVWCVLMLQRLEDDLLFSLFCLFVSNKAGRVIVLFPVLAKCLH